MRTLYLDCGMGAAGDMLTAALLELFPEPCEIISELNGLSVPGVTYNREISQKCGVTGTHVTVTVNGSEEGETPHDHDGKAHGHHHTSMHEISHIVEDLKLTENAKADVLAVYSLIADAESLVHGVPVTEVHFSEVGMMDAVADIAAVCTLMEKLAPQQVIVSPIQVGSGQVQCIHGILPVPAPATAYILRDVPIYSRIRGELCTPTGAALLKHFAAQFGEMPVMRIQKIGYGMGKKDFEAANCVRAMLGDTEENGDTVSELSCNLDDMTGEEIGFASERLFEAGALDVYTVPVGMKKSRPGILLCVICREAEKDRMLHLLFKYTTTIGVRETVSRRYKLERTISKQETPYGTVRRKSSCGYDITREKTEYEDIARVAKEKDISFEEARVLIEGTLK